MQHLKDFFSFLRKKELQNEVIDVLELLPYFEDLELYNWPALLDHQNGEPCTTILYQSEQLKMSLIYWKGKQTSSVHGHPGGGGLVKVLSGVLDETRYDPIVTEHIIDRYRMVPGNIGFIHDVLALHQVRNPHASPAVSLHLYSLIASEEAVLSYAS